MFAPAAPHADTLTGTMLPPKLSMPDRRNLGLIVLTFALMLFIIAPLRNYLVIDEGIYLPTLYHFHDTGTYVPPDLTQANLFGLVWLGWLWGELFGFSFTALSFLMLLVALLGLVGFYLLLRELEIAPNAALLGVALLGLNPLYLHLSDVFMTDVPFLTLLFYACLCYLRGLNGKGEWWLWLGSALVGYNFLIRQYAALIPIAMLLYLLLARRWRWRQVTAIALPAALCIGLFLLWPAGQPPNSGTPHQQASLLFTWNWPGVFFDRVLLYLPLLGLFTLPGLKLQRSWLAIPWFIITGGLLFLFSLRDNSTLDVAGNIIRRGGFDFFLYRNPPVLSASLWQGIIILGALLGALLLTQLSVALWTALPTLTRRRLPPVAFVYLLGSLLALVNLTLSDYAFDRYLLAFVPMIIVFRVRDSQSWSRAAWGYAVTAALLLGCASLLLQADYTDHATARWQAATSLVNNGVAPTDIWAGFEWREWHHMSDARDLSYQVAESPPLGYNLLTTVPYYTRLGGLTTRYIGVWRKVGGTTTLSQPVR